MPEFAPIEVPQGPLITPHTPNITGAEWPRLENVGNEIVAAAAKGAEINGRTRALENRLLAMQLAEQNKDIEHGLAVQRMAQQASQFAQNLFLKDKSIQSLVDERNWKERKYSDSMDDLGAYANALSKVDRNSPTAWNDAMSITADHAIGANTPGGRRYLQGLGDEVNKRTASLQTAAINDQKSIERTLREWNWQGFQPTSDPLVHPEWWRPAYKTDDAGNVVKDAQGNPVVDPNNKTYMIGVDQLKQPHYITRPTGEIDAITARYQRNQAALNREQVTDPTLGLHRYPVDASGGGGNMQYGTEEQARAAGHRSGETVSVYDPQRGTYRPYTLD